jgi:uncharacterized coiled-coil protein SlyX
MYGKRKRQVPQTESGLPGQGIANLPSLTASLRALEHKVAEQSQKIEELENRVRRQDSIISRLRHGTAKGSADISDLRRSLDTKVDRDW